MAKLEEKDNKQVKNNPETTETDEKDKEKTVKNIIGKLEEEVKKLREDKEKILRLQADHENDKKRQQKYWEDMAKYANEGLFVKILPTLGDFEQALVFGKQRKDANFSSFLTGFEMIFDKLINLLKSEGIKEIKIVPKKDIWDSKFHEVMGQLETNDYPPGTVLDIIRKGYLFNDQILLTAKVKISVEKKNSKKKEIRD